ncbi:glycosyltransferase [Flavimaricola marinus]|uniref:D-inositol-3-phosphate glycosyltransferase n=1 Tax=Flavimaricola marinus TaxID=1819565 RepID=A0A238LKZ4_9RHOB|nr:glycosyltransferase [Flavimaricola marinus]SMY10359.1 D-inositol-3-phosphate glycosyltransferase [Flavimaricola marinus]
MVSISVAGARKEVLHLTKKRDFLGAYRFLVSNGFSIEVNPALWTLLARRCADLGATTLASDLFRALWEVGVVTQDAALTLANVAIRQDNLQDAETMLTSVFGDYPDDIEARLLLAHACADDNPDRALELIRKDTMRRADGALLAVDILRRTERLEEALKTAERVQAKFVDDPRFDIRIARIRESLSDWPKALETWEQVAISGGTTEFTARSNQVRLLLRMERGEQAQAIAAELLRQEARLSEKVLLAANLGSFGLVTSLLQTGFLDWRRNPNDFEDWTEVYRILLDHGMVGASVWLQSHGVPAPRSIKDVVEIALSDEERRRIGRGTFSSAITNRAPEMFLDRISIDRSAAGYRPATADKILIINATLAAGGAERQLLALCTAIIEAGYDAANLHLGFFSLSADRGHDHFLNELTAFGLNIHRLAGFGAETCVLSEQDQARIALFPRQLRSDIIQTAGLVQRIKPNVLHGWQDRSALACGWVGLTNNVDRVVLSARNMQPKKRGMMQRYAAPLFQAFNRDSRVRLTANASACAKDYEKWLGLSDGAVQTLQNGIRTDTFRSVLGRRHRNRQATEIMIGGVFRLAANKRPLLWLQTLAELRAISPVKIKARLIGRGPFRDDILALAKVLGFNDLQMEDSLNSAEEIYGPMDVLLLMSRVEGLPNVILEAHATGLPVAACNVGGVAEALCQEHPSSGLLLPSDPSARQAAFMLNEWLPEAVNGAADVRQNFVENRFGMAALASATRGLYGNGVEDS